MRHSNRAPIAVERLDPHLDHIIRPPAPALGPLDGDHAIAEDKLFETQIIDLSLLESIEVDVIKRHAPLVLLDEGERRARHFVRVGADAARARPRTKAVFPAPRSP